MDVVLSVDVSNKRKRSSRDAVRRRWEVFATVCNNFWFPIVPVSDCNTVGKDALNGAAVEVQQDV